MAGLVAERRGIVVALTTLGAGLVTSAIVAGFALSGPVSAD
jgi:hypothetical protein